MKTFINTFWTSLYFISYIQRIFNIKRVQIVVKKISKGIIWESEKYLTFILNLKYACIIFLSVAYYVFRNLCRLEVL